MTENNGQAKFHNLGAHFTHNLPQSKFPSADAVIHEKATGYRRESKVDILLVNPPAPDGGIWIRSQHRVGRRSREKYDSGRQVSLAQLAALLVPDYRVEIIDAIALRMTWKEFEQILRDRKPLYYLTQVIAPTLTNDMYGVFLAKSGGATTIAFGTHVTPLAHETMLAFPALDFILRGEPELTLRELLDTRELSLGRWEIRGDDRLAHPQSGTPLTGQQTVWKMWQDCDASWKPAWTVSDDNEESYLQLKDWYGDVLPRL